MTRLESRKLTKPEKDADRVKFPRPVHGFQYRSNDPDHTSTPLNCPFTLHFVVNGQTRSLESFNSPTVFDCLNEEVDVDARYEKEKRARYGCSDYPADCPHAWASGISFRGEWKGDTYRQACHKYLH